jgi:hypothetical protein
MTEAWLKAGDRGPQWLHAKAEAEAEAEDAELVIDGEPRHAEAEAGSLWRSMSVSRADSSGALKGIAEADAGADADGVVA